MKRPIKVLVVDDNPHDRRLVVRELRKAYSNSEIVEAITQAQLDEQLVDGKFDVVVTDYHLQWSDGIRVLNSVKKVTPNCPVIMFTGTGSEEIAVEAMKQGLDDYIIKNVKHLVRLRGAVRSVLEHAVTRARAERLALRFESFLSQIRVGVFTCTPDGKFLDLNNVMVQWLGCEHPADAYKKTLNALLDDVAAEDFLRGVNFSKEAQEMEFARADGALPQMYFRLTARRVSLNGDQACIDGLVEDITRRKLAEAEAQTAAVAVARIEMLSPREKEVLEEVVTGLPNKAIARRLDIAEKTVEKHRSNLMKKLGIRSVAELVRLTMKAEAAE